jgi:hypothetical protein
VRFEFVTSSRRVDASGESPQTLSSRERGGVACLRRYCADASEPLAESMQTLVEGEAAQPREEGDDRISVRILMPAWTQIPGGAGNAFRLAKMTHSTHLTGQSRCALGDDVAKFLAGRVPFLQPLRARKQDG